MRPVVSGIITINLRLEMDLHASSLITLPAIVLSMLCQTNEIFHKPLPVLSVARWFL